MPIPSTMSDLSTTAASNYPTGSESPTTGDDYIRAYAAILRATNAKGADIASATTTDIGAATGEFVDVTGNTTITGLGTIASGIKRVVRFTGSLTLTYNATSLILPGNANITTANGDVAMFRSLGSGNWVCTAYLKRDGTSTVSPAPFIDSTALVKGSVDATKLLAFEVDTNQPTATTRTVTTQSTSGTMALVEDQLKPITASVAANALTITLNPCSLAFRSATLGSGAVNVRAVNSAISLVISSGSTLGTANAIQNRIVVIAIDNAGTVELAAVNISGGNQLDETNLISTTAEGGAGAADSANVIYSTTARSNVSYRIVGYVESTQATAGTWATAPSAIQGAGGQALQHVGAILNGGSQSLTSGTAKDFTGIPSWVQEIIVTYTTMSTNGTSIPILQIGDAGGIETTGYTGSASLVGTAATLSSGFAITQTQAAAYVTSGTLILTLTDITTNTWSCIGVGGRSDAAAIVVTGGSKSLSEKLDRLRFTTVNGTDQFDSAAGSFINVNWK